MKHSRWPGSDCFASCGGQIDATRPRCNAFGADFDQRGGDTGIDKSTWAVKSEAGGPGCLVGNLQPFCHCPFNLREETCGIIEDGHPMGFQSASAFSLRMASKPSRSGVMMGLIRGKDAMPQYT
jgi:hypothetical protein